jgi:hypothetical protein
MGTRKKVVDPDIRMVIDKLSDESLIDDYQLALWQGVAPSTVKRWRREDKLPPVTMIGGRPRHKVGNIRALHRVISK